MTTIEITEYADPGCPFGWSAEPSRRRVDWLYGDALTTELRMVGLHESGETMAARGMTTERLAAGLAHLAHAHHMPIDIEERERLWGTMDACRAVVAVRLHAPAQERAMLQSLRIEGFGGNYLDDPATLDAAARRAGVDPDELRSWIADPGTQAALDADLRATRDPSAEALALPGKLATTDDADAAAGPSGYRYTCPSWELRRDGRSFSVPGFQPLAAYELAVANLAPELERRPDPDDVSEVLAWADEPLATAEVAAVCAIGLDEAREQLGRVAEEEHVGTDGVWTLVG